MKLPTKQQEQETLSILILKQLFQNKNISIVHINGFGWNLDIVLAARLISIPVVLHCHNATTIRKSNLNRFACNKILAVSNGLLKEVESSGMTRGKGTVLYNSVDTDRYKQAKTIRRELGFKEGDILVCTVAQVCHRKGTDIVIETAKRIVSSNAKVHFLLVGPDGHGESEYADECRKNTLEYGIDKNVHFLGSRSDIPDVLKSVDIMFLPTRYEPFGMVITEAMAANVPVVASAVGGILEIINKPNIGVLLEDINVDKACEALQPLLESSELRTKIGQNGCNSLLGRLDKQAIGSRLMSIYDELLGLPAGTSAK